MADVKHKTSSRRASDARVLTPQHVPQKQHAAQRERRYFVSSNDASDDDDNGNCMDNASIKERPLPSAFAHTLQFQYKGDVFAQRGLYTDAALYMSRLPPTRRAAALRPKPGSTKVPAKLAPMALPARDALPHKSSNKALHTSGSGSSDKKRQYALAIEAMAANPTLHANLLRDNVVPNVVAMSRTKDAATLASCVAALCHLSCEAPGREAMLTHNALSVLLHVVANTLAHEPQVVALALGALANVTIDDTCESAFVKDKALESIMQSRAAAGAATKTLADAVASFAIFNLSCPAFTYPHVEDVIRALADLGNDTREREPLSRALYNFACTKTNQLRVVESPDAVALLCSYVGRSNDESVRRNAFAALYHLADNALCRRAVVRTDCVRALVHELPHFAADLEITTCALLTLLNLSNEAAARESMGDAQALDALDALSQHFRSKDAAALLLLVYKLIAAILSDPRNAASASESFLRSLLAFEHSCESQRSHMSCYVLFALACILSWSDQDSDGNGTGKRILQCDATTTGSGIPEPPATLDNLLDDESQHFARAFRHVAHDGFNAASPELYLQVLLLYNLSFRYNKVAVATLTAPWLVSLSRTSRDERVLSLLCGIYFNLCQDYAVHTVFAGAHVDISDDDGNVDTMDSKRTDSASSFDVLERFVRFCDDNAKSMGLAIVCAMFDGRQLPQRALVALAVALFPVLTDTCARGGATIRAGCAACFVRFAMLDACRVPMVQSGLVASLALLVSEDDPQTLRLCVHAYSYLCQSADVCATLIRSGIIKALTYLAAAPEEAVRRTCAITLCNISTSDANIDALVQGGALRALLVISCVKSKDPETRRICMKAVMNLLRHSCNIAQMCQDGLLWAFGLFVAGMEPTDFDILADAFCALAFYAETRSGATKAATLTRMLEILDVPDVPLATKAKVLHGVSNLLCDATNASLLLAAGVLPHLTQLVCTANCAVNNSDSNDVTSLIAQLFVLLFQSASELETTAFTDAATLRAVVEIVRNSAHQDCLRCCCLLLLRMSAHAETRRAIVLADAFTALPSLFAAAAATTSDAPTQLVRCVYNVSCDAALLASLAAIDVLPCVAMAAHGAAYTFEIAALSAGILRNASTASASWHARLVSDTTTALLCDLFAVNSKEQCREDVGICACNLFLDARSNTHELLARGLLPLVLALSDDSAADAHQVLSSAVLRKLALAPGNAVMLVDGGALASLTLLLHDANTSLVVKTNCVAVFGLLSQRAGVAQSLGASGVLSAVLELLDAHVDDTQLKTMCVDVLSALAAFARADDPRESNIASILFEHLDSGPDSHTGSAASNSRSDASWQHDRRFLQRAPDGPLLPLTLATTYELLPSALPTLRATLFPLLARGYSIELTFAAMHVETHTIEPLVPDFWSLPEASATAPRSSTTTFVPPVMFAKNRTPFTPSAIATQWPQPSRSAVIALTPRRKMPPLLHRRVSIDAMRINSSSDHVTGV